MIGAVLMVGALAATSGVHGWSQRSVNMALGETLVDRVRVADLGTERTVVLQGNDGRGWRPHWQGSAKVDGRVSVPIRPPATGHWRYRLVVPATSARTVVKRVRVAQRIYVAGDVGLCPPAGSPDKTAALISDLGPVIVPGDLAYPQGRPEDFASCYDPYWGRFKERTYPVPGNHEYYSGARGYFGYFGERVRPWYSLDIAGWRFYMLNSNCEEVGGCGPGSVQHAWLAEQLRTPQPVCTAAVWHHPRWSSGEHGPYAGVAPLYSLLAKAGTDVLLTGHDHDYERFARLAADGSRDRRGIRQFVVGTGGQTLRDFKTTARGSQVRLNASPGVLELDLQDGDYRWRFRPVKPGTPGDSGASRCL